MFMRNNRGFGLLEIVISVAVISVSLFSLAAVSRIAFRAVNESSLDVRANFLMEEGIEALRTIRDRAWSEIGGLQIGQTYQLVFSEGAWRATTTPQLIDGIFERTFVLDNVLRDANSNITSSGTLDIGTRRVTLKRKIVGGQSVEAVTYLTNLFQE